MNIIERIDKIIGDIDKQKLSVLFLQTSNIMLDLEDYESWIMLQFYIWGANDNVRTKLEQHINKILSSKGIEKDKQDKLFKNILEANKENFFKLSLNDMEIKIKLLEENKNQVQKNIDAGISPRLIGGLCIGPTWEEEMEDIDNSIAWIQKYYNNSKQFFTIFLTELRNIRKSNNKIKNYQMNISNNIFIIHGHDEAKRRELYTILKDDFNLNPIILSEKPNKGSTIIEKFECYAETCSYAFALFTPDDIVEKEGEQYFQARPNVIFELGWFFARLGRDRVCILNKESTKNNIFSDLQGILRYEFKKDVKERYAEIEKELVAAKIIAK